MVYLLQESGAGDYLVEQMSELPSNLPAEQLAFKSAASLLELYLETEDSSSLMRGLKLVRNEFIDDLDSVETVSEIYGLMYWLMQDYGIDNRGESLEETADRLGDIDIENDADQFTDLIFHLKDAVERLYDLELE